MTSPTQRTRENHPTGATGQYRILLRRPDGRQEPHNITPDNNIIVGSSANCSIKIDDDGVAPMHCLIRLNRGQLSVQDWYTEAGTFLNGRRIDQSAEFGTGDEITIGGFRLTAELADASTSDESRNNVTQDIPETTGEYDTAQHAAVSSSTADHSPERSARANAGASGTTSDLSQPGTQNADDDGQADGEETPQLNAADIISRLSGNEDATSPSTESEHASPTENTAGAPAELQSLRLRVAELEMENEELRQQKEFWTTSQDGGSADAFDEEMVGLLKAELEELQNEVAQRDARIAELTEMAETGGTTAESSPSDDEPTDTAALLERLERLLDELQSRDEHVAALEELLQAAEEATRAEQEERQQLSGWVSEIEGRIAQREQEWQAQQERLHRQIAELREERERFDERLREMTRRHGSTAQAHMLADLQANVEELTAKLQQSEDARDKLRKHIDSVEFQNTMEGQKKKVEELLREERLQLSQEYTQMARERAEVARMKAELEKQAPDRQQTVDDATCRVRAFREHLKDIHQQESASQKEAAGLSQRLSRLWKRLENW